MNHHGGLLGQFLGILFALLTVAVGTVIFIVSFGELLAILFFAGSVGTVGIGRVLVTKLEDADSGATALLGGAYVGLVLVISGLTYLLTYDPGIAGVMMGGTGFVGVVTALVAGAGTYAHARGKGDPRQ